MIRTPEELSKPIQAAVNRRAIVFSHIILAFTIAIHTFLAPTSQTYDRIGAVALGVVMLLLIVFRFFDMANINNRPKVYIAIYSLAVFIGYAVLTDPSTPYTLAAFIIVILTNLYYGRVGSYYSIALFGVTTVVKYVYASIVGPFTYEDKLSVIVAFFIFLAITSFFMNFQRVFDWERDRLHDTVKESVLEQKRLRALINNMTESVLVLDREGIIRLYNAAALALFNTNNSLSDKPLDGFIKLEDENGRIISTIDLLPKDSKPVVRDDVKLRYSEDDAASLSVVCTPIRPTFGQEHDDGGYVLTMRDISREKSLEEERDEFISVISHELRTPVTVAEAGVSNALVLAEKLPDNEKLTKSLNTAHDQAVFLAKMLNDLSTFARAEKGTLENNLEELDPREILESLRNDYRESVSAKHMNITTVIDPSTPLRLTSNRLYIREILQNFVTNAVKYSDKGTITLSCRAKDKGILFSVTDEGIGISVSDQKKVFQKFFRAEDYRTRSTSGTGLGLYIVKKLGKILDASFGLESEVGKGSTFSIYVPDKTEYLNAQKTQAAMNASGNEAPNSPQNNQSEHLQKPAPKTSPIDLGAHPNSTTAANSTNPSNLPKQG